MTIKTKLPNPWRDRYQPAAFRNAQFFVETDARVGGRRVAVHEYPKRNMPYAEDLGRKALRFLVQGYLIGPHYWEQKNRLIGELDKDGPGLLRLPLPYQMADVKVTVVSYTVTEGRERGGMCTVEMDFVEYGDPQFRAQINTAGQIEDSAFKLEDQLIGPPTRMSDAKVLKLMRYAEVHKSAKAGAPTVTQAINSLQFRTEMKI
ncbi:MAG TPA: DNA circularization N-terminal domain-containing protein [Casimicrobiaceae bacterium]|jgi:prophage DNA circulation protein|nr:DNA circularization N-terminal domain-containing protein [Casimicrobiaceae bacterium]